MNEAFPDKACLFVYGTLMKTVGGRMHDLLARHARYVGEAVFQGRLYLVSTYPGVIRSPDVRDQVRGEVYRLLAPERIFPRLDEYEGCSPDCPQPALYRRCEEKVRLVSGEDISAWIYLYNHPVDEDQRIASGDFLDVL